jgi:hypothetical protein
MRYAIANTSYKRYGNRKDNQGKSLLVKLIRSGPYLFLMATTFSSVAMAAIKKS